MRGIDEQLPIVTIIQKRIWFRTPYKKREMLFILKHWAFNENTSYFTNQEITLSQTISNNILKVYKYYPEKRDVLLKIFNRYADVDTTLELYPASETDELHICYLAGYRIIYEHPELYQDRLHQLAQGVI